MPANNCSSWEFPCLSGKCIPGYWKCDDYDDCGDGSDEEECSTRYPYYTTSPSSENCPSFKEPCGPGEHPSCIWSWWVCDGEADCSGGSDESSCSGGTERPGTTTIRPCWTSEFRCTSSNQCIPGTYRCNGYYDCSDGSDENNCGTAEPPHSVTTPRYCNANYFRCKTFFQCFDDLLVCDGSISCFDGTDEDLCDDTYTVSSFSADQVTETSVDVSWSISHYPDQFSYVLYMRDVSSTRLPEALTLTATQQQNRLTWNNLQLDNRYEFTIAVMSGGKEYQKASLLMLTINNDELPSIPKKVTLFAFPVHDNIYGVNITWEPPSSSHIDRYEINYRINGGIDEEISNVPGNVHIKLFLSLLQNHMYEFKVRAVNNAGPSLYTEVQSVYVGDPNAIKEAPTGLVIVNIDTHFIHLKWNPLIGSSRVDGYVVFYSTTNDIDNSDRVLNHTIGRENTNLYSEDLCEGTQYTFTVAGKNYISTGPKATPYKSAETDGRPYKPPINLIGNALSTTTVNLTWSRVPLDDRTFTYKVFYGRSLNQLTLADSTKDTRFEVTGLESGIEYYFTVQAEDSIRQQCHSSLSPPILVTTFYDVDSHPRELEMLDTFISKKTVGMSTVSLRWRSPRDHPHSLAYLLHYYINGTDPKNGQQVKVPATLNTTINHNLTSLSNGATYVIFVTTSYKNARPSSSIFVTAATYAPPETFNHYRDVATPSVISLRWNPSQDKIALDLGYSVFMLNVSQLRPNVTSVEAVNKLMKEDSLWANIFNTTSQSYAVENLIANRIYGFTVSVGYYKGYHGQFAGREAVNFTFYTAPDPHPQPSHGGEGPFQAWVLVGIGGVVVLVILLAAALVYFVVRHQRLQRSFMSFANSHYDTRSGTATFNPEENTTDLGSEEEDQPIIRGFSDDEPLVVA